jgi:hypothetical protein
MFRGQNFHFRPQISNGERLSQNHKIFDKQAKTATTNGVFQAKILQINIVQKWRFLYYFSI